MRALAIIAALIALVGAAVAPGAARAQQDPTGGSPFAPLPPPQQEPPPAPEPQNTPTTPTNPNDQTLSTPAVLGLFGAGILAIVAIGFLIMRDARRSLPRRKRRGSARGDAKPQPKGRRAAKASATAATAAAGAASGKRAPPPPPRKRGSKKQRAKRRSR